MFSVRLACVKRAASVRPEPGSNSLWKLYIQTLRVFISILAITIRSQLPLWFFRLFWLLKIPNLFGISRAFSLVVHCSIFKILVSGFRAATFTLYHIQKFLSSKHFVNCCSFLLFSNFFFSLWPAFLFYHILFSLSSKQFMNQSSNHSLFFLLQNKLPKTVSLSILSHFCFPVKWTFLEQPSPVTVNLPIRALAPFALSFS